MKKFLMTVAEIKTWICLCFTASLLIYMGIDFFCGGRAIRYSLILQLLGLCIGITLLQFVFFSGRVLKKPSYALRLCVFGVLIYGLVGLFAVVFGWFPLEEPGAWLASFVIFIVAFVAISLGFEIFFRIMGKRYDALLGRRRGGEEENGE